jgi:hypothetical protein
MALANALIAALNANEAAITKLATGKHAAQFVNANDVNRKLGNTQEATSRAMLKKAALKPKEFDDEREAAYLALYASVEKAYNDAYDSYIAAGFPHDEAEKEGMVVAKTTKAALIRALNSKFGIKAKEANASVLSDKAMRDILDNANTGIDYS